MMYTTSGAYVHGGREIADSSLKGAKMKKENEREANGEKEVYLINLIN